MSKEIWKPIIEYEGLYEISNLGRVKSLRRKVKTGFGTRLQPEIILRDQNNQGYRNVQLKANGNIKNFKVHTLVAQAFLPKPEINHIDENKSNNNVENLEWVSHKQNMNCGTVNKRMSDKGKINIQLRKRDLYGRLC